MKCFRTIEAAATASIVRKRRENPARYPSRSALSSSGVDTTATAPACSATEP